MRLWLWERGAFGVLRHDAPQEHSIDVYLGWLALLSALAVATWLFRKDRVSTFGLAWVGCLLPVINIVPLGTTPVAMHYLYLPGAGLALLVARGGQQLTRTLSRGALLLRAAPVTLLLLVLAAWQPEHVEAIARWGDDVLLYEASVASQPKELEVRTNLVAAYLRRDRLHEADALLEASLAMAPGHPLLVKNRFELLRRMGRPQEALEWLDAHPNVLGPEFLYRKAQLQELLGQRGAAIDTYARAADLTRDDEERYWASLHHARLLLQSGRSDEGLRALSRLVERYPDRPELQVLRAGRLPEARKLSD
jgi:tetratricopeptide (TPR) repeat protein